MPLKKPKNALLKTNIFLINAQYVKNGFLPNIQPITHPCIAKLYEKPLLHHLSLFWP